METYMIVGLVIVLLAVGITLYTTGVVSFNMRPSAAIVATNTGNSGASKGAMVAPGLGMMGIPEFNAYNSGKTAFKSSPLFTNPLEMNYKSGTSAFKSSPSFTNPLEMNYNSGTSAFKTSTSFTNPLEMNYNNSSTNTIFKAGKGIALGPPSN
jgi:hypothetical protein|tara:strand:- start:9 stop:467 length:459 start_codon:yes stop_codon:yes gene_type:complete